MTATAECQRCGAPDAALDRRAGKWLCEQCVGGGRNRSTVQHHPEPPSRTQARTHDRANVPTPPLPTSGVEAPVDVPVPVPSIEETERLGERADLRVELDRYAAGDAIPQQVPAPRLPTWTTPAMRRVCDDLRLCSGLLRAAGDDGTVIYAVDWVAARLRLSSSTVSSALSALRKCGAIRLVKVLPRTDARRRAGSRVYAIASPGDDLPARAGVVEAARSVRVDERQEVGDDIAVGQAVAHNGREGAEADDRLSAPEGSASREAGQVVGVAGHVTQPIPEVGAAGRPRNAVLRWEATP